MHALSYCRVSARSLSINNFSIWLPAHRSPSLRSSPLLLPLQRTYTAPTFQNKERIAIIGSGSFGSAAAISIAKNAAAYDWAETEVKMFTHEEDITIGDGVVTFPETEKVRSCTIFFVARRVVHTYRLISRCSLLHSLLGSSFALFAAKPHHQQEEREREVSPRCEAPSQPSVVP